MGQLVPFIARPVSHLERLRRLDQALTRFREAIGPMTAEARGAPAFGIPLVVDHRLPPGSMEFRGADGALLLRVDGLAT